MLTVLLLLPAKPCLAAGIASPDTMTVNSIDAYQSCINTLDQLYIVSFSLGYTVNPDDLASTNFLIRFKDNGVEIAATTPYAFYGDGYSDGVVAFYFAADDADLPAWGVNDISIEMLGNPALTWTAGDPPTITNSVVDSWNTSDLLVPAKIRILAQQLENAYGVDMIELISGSLKLTAFGVLYFDTVIPNLRAIAPSVLSDVVTQPQYITENHTLAGQTELEGRLSGTIFDQAGTAALLGISTMWVYSIIWLIFSGIVVFFYATRIGTIGLNWIIAVALEVGAFGGWMPTSVGVGFGIMGGLLIIYPLFFRSASA